VTDQEGVPSAAAAGEAESGQLGLALRALVEGGAARTQAIARDLHGEPMAQSRADRRASLLAACGALKAVIGQPEISQGGAGQRLTTNAPSPPDPPAAVVALLARSIALVLESARVFASQAVADQMASTSRALFNRVARPLSEHPEIAAASDQIESLVRAAMLTDMPTKDGVDAKLLRLADEATGLCLTDHAPALIEATAGLQRLALEAGLSDSQNWFDQLQTDPNAVPSLQVTREGPYLASLVTRLTDHLGVTLPATPSMALCRCGRSQSKPFCDGSHAVAQFSDEIDPRRVPDHRDTYVGQHLVIYDNRGICAHSGFCTDRLASVFHAGSEPFVTPSGGRMDEIMRAVRNCPSGALSLGFDGAEDRGFVDQSRPPRIEVSKDGPYRITGGLALLDQHGDDLPRLEGVSREHCSLCRCGASQNKPFCSGMHWYVNFADPVPDEDHLPTLFEWAGGYPALLRTTEIFYEKYVPQDPLIGPLFASMSPDHPERVACWLSEVFGGPKLFSERYGGYERMISQHLNKQIKPEQRARWAALIAQSAEDAGLPGDAEFRAAFIAYIEWGSRIAVENSQAGVEPPPHMPVPRWWWVCEATPGARPKAKPAGESDASQQAPPLPDPDTPLSFAAHIKPLFRPMDRNSMRFAFDLWAYDDAAQHGEAILARIKSGTMPCDGAWPAEKIAVLERWLGSGKAP